MVVRQDVTGCIDYETGAQTLDGPALLGLRRLIAEEIEEVTELIGNSQSRGIPSGLYVDIDYGGSDLIRDTCESIR